MVVFIALLAPFSTSAATITDRGLSLSNNLGGATGTTYTFTFTVPTTATIIKSFKAQICTTVDGSCTTPTGFDGASSTASDPTNFGDASGWSIDSNTGNLRIKKSTNSATPSGSQTVTFSNVTNPTTMSSSFYARIFTYSDDAYSVQIDEGTVVSSIGGTSNLNATLNQTLSFSISDATIGFGALSSSAARYATGDASGDTSETEAHTLIVGTNASGGYGLTVNASQANPFRSGSNYIASSDTNVASSVGTQQFGLRATASGGSGAVTAPYAASGFALASSTFPTASQVASASGATSDTTYSVRYISNITSNTAAGIYTATLTYVATATY